MKCKSKYSPFSFHPSPLRLTVMFVRNSTLPVLDVRDSSDDFSQNPYGYLPTEWICILFLVLFSVSTGGLTRQFLFSK